jgi:putative endonuclease
MAKHNDIGALGENAAARRLEEQGHEVIDRNVRYPYGEIDMVTREKIRSRMIFHFVEVKTVARERSPHTYNPLQNISREKLARQRRAIQAYLMGHREIVEWCYDVMCVYLPPGKSPEFEYIPKQVL